MAVVLDSLATTRTRQVFTRPPDLLREYTAWPRAITQFHILNGVISAKPLNDTAELVVSFVLELRAAYRMLEFNASLTQDTAADWRPVGYIELLNAIRGTPAGTNTRHPVVILDTGIRDSSDDEMWVADVERPGGIPRYVIQATRQGIAPTVNFMALNANAAAAAAGTFNCYMSFLEYDIEQVEHLPMHYPVAVYRR